MKSFYSLAADWLIGSECESHREQKDDDESSSFWEEEMDGEVTVNGLNFFRIRMASWQIRKCITKLSTSAKTKGRMKIVRNAFGSFFEIVVL